MCDTRVEANHLLLSLPPSLPPSLPLCAQTCIETYTHANIRTDPPSLPASLSLSGPFSWLSRVQGWFKGSLQMGRLQVKTKTRDKSQHSRLKVSTKPIQLGGSSRTVKNIHTLHPVRALLAYLEWLSRLGISGNGQKYIKLISRWMLSGVMMLHKSWFDHCGQGLNPQLPNAHSSVLDWILFCLGDRSP